MRCASIATVVASGLWAGQIVNGAADSDRPERALMLRLVLEVKSAVPFPCGEDRNDRAIVVPTGAL